MRILLFIMVICIFFSGCIEEKNTPQSNELVHQVTVNITQDNLSSTTFSSEENIPEIKVTSLSNIYTLSNLKKTDIYFFNWDNVPGNESQNLISYLKNDLDIGWVDNAQIVKTNNNKTIRVFTSKNSLEFILKNNKTDILVKINSVPWDERGITTYPWYNWGIKNENGNVRVYGPEDEYIKGYNITEKHYLVYGLSITNNGSNNLDFKLNDLHVRYGDQIFNTTHESEIQRLYRSEIISDLENETKIEDTALSPGQNINGFVVFQVNSLYNASPLLMHKETPVPSASVEKSIEALRMAERFNYSVTFGIPPYNNGYSYDSFEPDLKEYPYIWPNWVNRSIFDYFNKVYSENLAKSFLNDKPGIEEDTPETGATYALKVIPERNITLSHHENYFTVVDDAGEELINTSSISNVAILENQTYELYSGENVTIPQMNFSNATIVIISYENEYSLPMEAPPYGWPMESILSFIDQDLILDDKMNIAVVRWRCLQAQS